MKARWWESIGRRAFFAIIGVALVVAMHQSGYQMPWSISFPTGALYFLIFCLVGQMAIDPFIRHRRRRHRSADEAHHEMSRRAVREPQVAALATFSFAVLEDLEDQYQSRLATGFGRLSVLVGEKAAIVTSALGVMGAYKAVTEFRWVNPGSPAVGAFFVIGIAIVLLPAFIRTFSERQIYQCDLLASAKKRKMRGTVPYPIVESVALDPEPSMGKPTVATNVENGLLLKGVANEGAMQARH